MEHQVGVVGTDGGLMTSQTSAALGSAALPFLPTPMDLGTTWGRGLTGDTKRTSFCCLPSCEADLALIACYLILRSIV